MNVHIVLEIPKSYKVLLAPALTAPIAIYVLHDSMAPLKEKIYGKSLRNYRKEITSRRTVL
jgi:hypothetical protein